jgi:hypothetical protein
VIIRLVNALEQAALLDALSHYAVSTDSITSGEQTYPKIHKAPKESTGSEFAVLACSHLDR